MSRSARIEIRPTSIPAKSDAARPHYLRLVASNGQVLATSEVYASRRNARRAVSAWIAAFDSVGRLAWTQRHPVVEFDADGNQR